MRRIGELMQELGFNADAPIETQKAFVRHLIAKASGQRYIPLAAAASPKTTQLSFDPEILGVQQNPDKKMRRAR